MGEQHFYVLIAMVLIIGGVYYYPADMKFIEDCFNVTKWTEHHNWTEDWVNETWEWRDHPYWFWNYTGEVNCTEVGVWFNGTAIYYNQTTKQCARDNEVMCCWLHIDGGHNYKSRSNEFKRDLREGESGYCLNLIDTEITKEHSDFGAIQLND